MSVQSDMFHDCNNDESGDFDNNAQTEENKTDIVHNRIHSLGVVNQSSNTVYHDAEDKN